MQFLKSSTQEEKEITALNKYKLFIICETVEIAKAIIEATGEKTLNIGNIAYHENAKLYGRSAYMDAAELALVKEMVDDSVDVFIQMIPADKVIKCKSLF
jgi:fructoselysine and glucoselysine-specific PTS system IIB component